MTKILDDPLLTAARFGTYVAQIGLIIGQIVLAFVIVGAVVAATGNLPAEVAEVEGIENLEPAIMWSGALAVLLIVIALGLATQFVVRLRQIIDTVGQGDPFVAENGRRLTRMAWLALIGQILAMLAGAIGGWIQLNGGDGKFEFQLDVSFTGLFIAIILFILARVFRKGTEMRAELEGTV